MAASGVENFHQARKHDMPVVYIYCHFNSRHVTSHSMPLYFVDDSLKEKTVKHKFNTYKEAFLQTEQYDVKVLLGFIQAYKYFFMTPLTLQENGNCKAGKYLSILMSMVCLIYCYFSVKTSYELLVNSPITRFLLAALWCCMNTLFLISCFLHANTFKQEKWKTVLKSIDQAEYTLLKLNFQTPKNNPLLFLQFGLVFVPFFVLTTAQVLVWISVGDMRIVYTNLGAHITYLNMCLFLLFIMRLTGVLKTRYDFVEENLRKIVAGKMDDQGKVKKLCKVIRLYKTFIILVDNLSDIFGSHLFFYIGVSISYILCAISYNMNISTENVLEKNLSILNVVTTIVYIVSALVFSFIYDKYVFYLIN